MVRHYVCNNPDFDTATVRIEYNKDGRKETHHEVKRIDKTHVVVKGYDLIYDKDDNLIERVELGTKERTIEEQVLNYRNQMRPCCHSERSEESHCA